VDRNDSLQTSGRLLDSKTDVSAYSKAKTTKEEKSGGAAPVKDRDNDDNFSDKGNMLQDLENGSTDRDGGSDEGSQGDVLFGLGDDPQVFLDRVTR